MVNRGSKATKNNKFQMSNFSLLLSQLSYTVASEDLE